MSGWLSVGTTLNCFVVIDKKFKGQTGRQDPNRRKTQLQNYQISSTIEIMFKRLVAGITILGFLVCFIISQPLTVFAETLQSTNFKIDESSVGIDDQGQSSSTNYKTDTATGALSVGNSTSGNFQIDNGTKTSSDPTLSFAIGGAGVDFGNFSAGTATTGTATFSVSNYTSYGYVAQIVGKAPNNVNHTINAMATSAASQTGKDQFGINLVANTLPRSLGSNPDTGQFGFGSTAPNYAVPNQYRYVSGETIAQSVKSSGITNYTISYLVNVADMTPGGKYTCDQTIIVTGTY